MSDLANFLAGVTSGYFALIWCGGVRGMLQGCATVRYARGISLSGLYPTLSV